MEFLPVVCLCLLSCSGTTSAAGNEPVVKVVVTEDSEAILPCSLRDKRNIEDVVFDWKRDDQKEVFKYDAGVTYNDGLPGQDEQFRGRVSHFEDELKNGVASIKIQNTKWTDSGNYTCIFPHFQPRQRFHIRLVVEPKVKVVVTEDSEAILPCSLIDKRNLENAVFDWKRDDQKEVFKYDAGVTYNDGLPGQDEQFRGRVSHFEGELKNGVASIKIQNTKWTDSGVYTCIFPNFQPRETFHIKLVVDQVLRDRSEENKGAAEPDIKVLVATENWWLLQCEAHGTEPLTVEWQDGANNKLQAEKPETSERGGQLYITVKINVTKNDNYTCVATQKNISHQIVATIPVHFQGAAPEPSIKVQHELHQAVLLCETHGSPRPTLEWRDGANKTLDAEEPQTTDRKGRQYITLRINVTKTNKYSCVATQKNISHQIFSEISLSFQGAASKPSIEVQHELHQAVLQCEAHGSPRPTLEWRDGANKTLDAEDSQTTDRGGRQYITLRINVTKTDKYSCVATQKNISHQIFSEISLSFQGPTSPESGTNTGLVVALVVSILIIVVGGVLCGLYNTHVVKQNGRSQQSQTPGEVL